MVTLCVIEYELWFYFIFFNLVIRLCAIEYDLWIMLLAYLCYLSYFDYVLYYVIKFFYGNISWRFLCRIKWEKIFKSFKELDINNLL